MEKVENLTVEKINREIERLGAVLHRPVSGCVEEAYLEKISSINPFADGKYYLWIYSKKRNDKRKIKTA